MSEAKPYDISKQLVWEAYQRVKANRGAAGVDGVSLAAFEKDLKGNRYKVWNRMSSGSYIRHPRAASSRSRRTTAARARSAFRPLPTACRRRSSRWSWSPWWRQGQRSWVLEVNTLGLGGFIGLLTAHREFIGRSTRQRKRLDRSRLLFTIDAKIASNPQFKRARTLATGDLQAGF